MRIEKQELTTLTFIGPSFEDHGLELDMLPELVQYKKILRETAEHLWRLKHPDRTRLPRGFKEGLRIKFYSIGEGSTAVPLMREIEYEDDQLPFDYRDELNEAVVVIEEGISAAGEDRMLPDNFPKNVIPLFGDLGKNLGPEDHIEIKSPRREKPTPFNTSVREKLLDQEEKTYEDLVDLTGEVRAADLDGLNFTIRLEAGVKGIPGKFEPEQEMQIIEALKDHTTCRLNIIGVAEFLNRDGSIKRIFQVDKTNLRPFTEKDFDDTAQPIWELVSEIGAQVPEKEWEKIPSDLSKEVDHYLYGTPRTEN
ncbi:MAG: hypothetical protein KKB20_21075 [Proteobacteria bacterium]|nr:hypothetical protein [Pseudomonadota bacterium]